MYLNKLLILKKIQETNGHLGSIIKNKKFQWNRFSAYRYQSFLLGFREKSPILDLDNTIVSLRRSCHLIQLIIQANGHILFVNTNPRFNKIVQQTAKESQQSYINHKWIGGFLTNWNQMQNVQRRFEETTKFSQKGPKARREIKNQNADASRLGAKRAQSIELLRMAPRFKKMQKCFEGTIDSYKKIPDCLVVLNAMQNSTAIYEAHLNQIPIISLVDANVPSDLYKLITYPIPANYESAQFVYLFCNSLLKTFLYSQKKEMKN
jgi:small subunit ribosomal protein S2